MVLGRRSRLVGLGFGLMLGGPVLLGIEAFVASRGRAPDPLPVGANGCVGCDGSTAALRTVWLGDSTAAGVGVTAPEQVLGRQVAGRLGRPVDVQILAASGATVADVVARQLPRLPTNAQVIFVSVGANDTTHLKSTKSFSSAYRTLLAGLPKHACVVLLGLPDMGSPPRLAQPLRAVVGWRARRLDQEVRSLARATGHTYVDIAGTTGRAFRRDHTLFSPDNYHPGVVGYGLWAGAVTAAMEGAGIPNETCP